jgi:hypothetical protein
MSREKRKIEHLADEVAFWHAYREIYRAKGIDIAQFYADLAADEKQRLKSRGARDDFTELCEDGCFDLVLSAIVALFRFSPHLENFWIEMVGSAYRREKTTKTLEKAGATLEGLFDGLIASEDEDHRTQFRKMGRLPLSSLVSELRFYIKLINGADRIAADTGLHSLKEVCKYLLASYVKRAMGSFHDRNVSGLIAVSSAVGVGKQRGRIPERYLNPSELLWRLVTLVCLPTIERQCLSTYFPKRLSGFSHQRRL